MTVLRGGLRLGALFSRHAGKKEISCNGVELESVEGDLHRLEAMIKDIRRAHGSTSTETRRCGSAANSVSERVGPIVVRELRAFVPAERSTLDQAIRSSGSFEPVSGSRYAAPLAARADQLESDVCRNRKGAMAVRDPGGKALPDRPARRRARVHLDRPRVSKLPETPRSVAGEQVAIQAGTDARSLPRPL